MLIVYSSQKFAMSAVPKSAKREIPVRRVPDKHRTLRRETSISRRAIETR